MHRNFSALLLVSKILNSESNSQHAALLTHNIYCCCWYQRYWILKAIHNGSALYSIRWVVVVGIKDTEFWKQFTTRTGSSRYKRTLLLVSKILNSESNSQRAIQRPMKLNCCCWYQRYWILKAIHNHVAE